MLLKRLDWFILVLCLSVTYGIWRWGSVSDKTTLTMLNSTKIEVVNVIDQYREHMFDYVAAIAAHRIDLDKDSDKTIHDMDLYIKLLMGEDRYLALDRFVIYDTKNNTGTTYHIDGQESNIDTRDEKVMDVIREEGDDEGYESKKINDNHELFLYKTTLNGEIIAAAISLDILSKEINEVADNVNWSIADKNGVMASFGEISADMTKKTFKLEGEGGGEWEVILAKTKEVSGWWGMVLASGVLFSFALYAILYFFSSAGARAEAIAQEMTRDLVKYKLALDSSFSHLIITDPDGVIVYANDAVSKLTGYTREEILGSKPSLWGKQMSEDFYRAMWRQIKEEKKIFQGEINNRRKNGSIYIARATVSPILEQNGELLGFVGVEEDVTEERAASLKIKQEVEERTKQLRAVIDSIARGLIVINHNKEIVLQNKIIPGMIGKSGEVTYQDLLDYTANHLPIEEYVNLGFELHMSKKSKPVLIDDRYILVHVVPIALEGNVSEVAIFLNDVSEQENLSRSKDEFFSIASHELRTPLTAIRGNAEMLMEQYGRNFPDKDSKEMLEDIHEGSIRLIEIVRDFLDISRLEMGKIQFKTELCDLAKIAGEVKEELIASVPKNISLNVEVMKDTLVYADKVRLKQVLVNLVGNAIKFTHEGSIVVSAQKQNEKWIVRVSDTGEGVALEQQSLLFHKFQQAGTSLYTRDTSRGTGLGLYISKLLVEGMHGKIYLEKTVIHKGSTFAFSLPCANN